MKRKASLPADCGTSRATARRVVTGALALLAFAGLVFVLYVTSTHVYAGGSDRATTILEGQAVGSGNPLLHGWILTGDSFWTTDAFFYALAVRAGGLWPGLLNLEPALAVATTVVVGAFVASRGHKRAAAAAAATVVALLALCTHALASFLLGGPDHVTTACLALLAFAALRHGRFDWKWAAALAALSIGMFGDLLMVAYGIVPIFCAGVVSMLRARHWKAGIAPAAASVAAVIACELFSWLVSAMGAFSSVGGVSVAPYHQILVNLRHVLSYGANLVGFSYRFDAGGVPNVLQDVHVVSALLIAACSLIAVASMVRRVANPGRDASSAPESDIGRWWLDDVLAIAMFGPAVTFVFLAVDGTAGARYLVATVVFASVLSGRMVAQAWQRLGPGWLTRAICVVGAAASLWLGAGVGYTISQPIAVHQAATLASWLEAHNLQNGVGGYWAASVTTVESRGAITVRPVWSNQDGKLGRYMKLSSASWYANQRFQFLVYQSPAYQGVDAVAAAKTWGAPAHSYVVSSYHVLVWSSAFSVPPFP